MAIAINNITHSNFMGFPTLFLVFGLRIFSQLDLLSLPLLVHFGFGVNQIAKSNSTRWTGLLTRCPHFTVMHETAFVLRVVLGHRHPLDTERAFFHHTFAAHRYIRVQLLIHFGRPDVVGGWVVIPVEVAHFVWTVRLTVSRTYAAVSYTHLRAHE